MKLHEAIAYAIEREGEDIITRSLLVNHLAHLQAYIYVYHTWHLANAYN